MKLVNLPFGSTAKVVDKNSVYFGQILVTSHFRAVFVIGTYAGIELDVSQHIHLEVEPVVLQERLIDYNRLEALEQLTAQAEELDMGY